MPIANNFMRPILITLILALVISCNNNVGKERDAIKAAYKNKATKLLLSRPSYSLAYLSDWTIDSSKQMEGVETHFTMNSSNENGMITFFLFDHPKEESEELEKHLKAQLKRSIKDGLVKYITNWGNYKGHGAIIKGKNIVSMQSKLIIFVSSTADRSFLITSICADDYEDEILPGLNLIESSFRMKY